MPVVRADADLISLKDLLHAALKYDAGEPIPDAESDPLCGYGIESNLYFFFLQILRYRNIL
jgi:hypothetical protein